MGERCNANGSRRFRDLMLEGDLDGMVGIAKAYQNMLSGVYFSHDKA